ncbi:MULTISPECIES: hypothetical protein [unclassified Streptomyces]|uniref:hypothetical protein n=1 Tax=unclassified Streptomyces TaxID=2593676 RepID=UPI003328C090
MSDTPETIIDFEGQEWSRHSNAGWDGRYRYWCRQYNGGGSTLTMAQIQQKFGIKKTR